MKLIPVIRGCFIWPVGGREGRGEVAGRPWGSRLWCATSSQETSLALTRFVRSRGGILAEILLEELKEFRYSLILGGKKTNEKRIRVLRRLHARIFCTRALECGTVEYLWHRAAAAIQFHSSIFTRTIWGKCYAVVRGVISPTRYTLYLECSSLIGQKVPIRFL